MPMPSESAILAWSRLIRAQRAALCVVEQELRAEGLPPLEWYDVLWELERAGPLRPRDLQGRLLLAQYNLSRLLDRMAEAGLVERRSCSSDRRGQFIAATKEGLKLRRRVWPVYARAIEAAIGAKLGEADAEALAMLLGRLYDTAPAAPSAPVPRGSAASSGRA